MAKARWFGRRASNPATAYKKLSPAQLRARGLSPKSERYLGPADEVISKRQYQQQQLRERAGRDISLLERARLYFSGVWEYLTGGRRKAAAAKRAAKRAAKLGGIPPDARARLDAMARDRAKQHRGYTPKEMNIISKNMDLYGRQAVLEVISPQENET